MEFSDVVFTCIFLFHKKALIFDAVGVCVAHFNAIPAHLLYSPLNPQYAGAHLLYTSDVMGYEEDRDSLGTQLLEFFETFVLEKDIPHAQGFIHNENIRFHINRYGKCKPGKHSTRIIFNRLTDKITDICKIQNRWNLSLHFFP